KTKVERPYQGAVISGGMFFTIPAGAERHTLRGKLWATEDLTLYSVMPHMHLLGKEVKVTLTSPDGAARTLLAIKEWDYNWQETYFFKQPLHGKAGTRLEVEAMYDNSAANPNNPNAPPRPVRFGEQTTNEMCFVFLGGVSARPGQRLPLTSTQPAEKRPDGP